MVNMPLEGEARLVDKRPKTSKYPRIFIYIETELYRDSAFPFKIGDKLKVSIKENRLVLERIDEHPTKKTR
jgi:hypothetical protein